LNGPAAEYYENGKKETEMTYKNGGLDGIKTMWTEKGKKQGEATYKDGNLVEGKSF
jgi:antitoxin component YwqK of YwqJK toxin-antitoxin module